MLSSRGSDAVNCAVWLAPSPPGRLLRSARGPLDVSNIYPVMPLDVPIPPSTPLQGTTKNDLKLLD